LLALADDFIRQPLRFLGKHVHDDHRVVFTRPCSQTTGIRCSFSSTGSIYRMRYVGNLRLSSPLMARSGRAYSSPSTPAGPCLGPGAKVVPWGRPLSRCSGS
jgi:hypothetical protein